MNSAAMEGVMSGQQPVTTITFVRTGDAGLDLISLVLQFVRNSNISPDGAVNSLYYVVDRIKFESNRRGTASIDERQRAEIARQLAKLRGIKSDDKYPDPIADGPVWGGMSSGLSAGSAGDLKKLIQP